MKLFEIFKEDDKSIMVFLEVEESSRDNLLKHFPPKYHEVIAHHITYKGPKNNIPTDKDNFEVVGYTDDGVGLEAVVVAINGDTTRLDGNLYHITLSIDRSKGYKPVHSNDVIKETGFENISPPMRINIKKF